VNRFVLALRSRRRPLPNSVTAACLHVIERDTRRRLPTMKEAAVLLEIAMELEPALRPEAPPVIPDDRGFLHTYRRPRGEERAA
jgi:hypothetical protein